MRQLSFIECNITKTHTQIENNLKFRFINFLSFPIQNPMNDSADIQIRFFKAKKDLTTAAATYSIEVASMEMGKGTDC